MAKGTDIITDLLFNIGANTAELKQGLRQANNSISSFSKGVSQIGNLIKGAFAATAIIGAAKEIFNFSQEIGKATDKLRLMGLEGQNLIDATAKARAISEILNVPFEKLLESAKAVSKEMGIGVPQALDMIRDGYAQTGSEEFLDMLREYPAQFASAGASADQFFAIATQSINEGIYSDKGVDAIKEAGLRLREMTPATKDALAAIGISSADMQRQIANGSITTFQAIQQVSARLQGFKDDSKQVGMVLADVFGGAGEDAGVRFVKMLGNANQSFAEMTANANETVKAQIHLTKANEDLNAIWVKMFGQSSTFWTELKADMIDIAVIGIRGIIKGSVDIINYFIELYNESVLFRASIQILIGQFKQVWNLIKLVGKNIIDTFGNGAKLIRAVFTANFDEIPGIYKKAMEDVINNTLEFAKETGENLRTGIQNVLEHKPIQLISMDEVATQAKEAVKTATQVVSTIGNGRSLQGFEFKKPETALTANAKPKATKYGIEKMIELQSMLNEKKEQEKRITDELKAKHEAYAASLQSAFMTVNGAVSSAGDSFQDMAKAALNAIAQIIKGLIAEGIAGAVAKSLASAPFPIGLILATAAGAAAGALLNKVIPQFEKGGMHGGGLALVGEKGAELINTGRARVFNHRQTKDILSGSGGIGNMKLEAVVSGEQIKFVLDETNRRRGIR